MKKLTIEDIEEIEEWSKAAHGEADEAGVYKILVRKQIPRLIADNRRLRNALNKLAGQATEAVS